MRQDTIVQQDGAQPKSDERRSALPWPISALRRVSILFLSYSALALVWTLGTTFRGFVGFCCETSIDQDGCLWLGRGAGNRTGELSVFLTTYDAGYSGGGCVDESARPGHTLQVAGHLFLRDGEDLIVDKTTVLKKGESWESSRVVSWWKPWRITVERTSVANNGILTCVHDDQTNGSVAYGPTLVAIGDTGTSYRLSGPGILLIGVFFVILCWTYVWQDAVSR